MENLTPEFVEELAREEEARWEAAYAAVEKALEKKEREFKTDRVRARAMTSEIVATRREEEKMLLLNDERVSHGLSALRKSQALSLDSLLDQPYFARVVCEEDGREFEFCLGTASFPEARIVDWRESPLAAIYYNYGEGDRYTEVINDRDREGTVKLRRSFRGKGRHLAAIELPQWILSRSEGGWTAARKSDVGPAVVVGGGRPKPPVFSATVSGSGPQAAAFSRGADHDGHLPQILSLLTPEQYALITAPTDRPMVIQGSAGSGKTTVALHRLAWLLSEKNSDARKERCLVTMHNQSLHAYIKYTLPELGIDGVRIETFGEWAEKILHPLVGPRKRLHLGRDAEVLTFKALPELLPVLKTFAANQTSRMCEVMKKELMRFDARARAFWEVEVAEKLRASPAVLEHLRAAIAKAKTTGLSAPFVALLEQVMRRLALFAGDLHLLWQDEALLEGLRGRYYTDRPLVWKRLKDELRLEVSSKQYDLYDDPLLLHLIFLKWGRYPLGGTSEALDHLVVDEVQDFSVAELAALKHAVRAPHELTFVGDLAQKIVSDKSFSSWGEVLAALGFKDTAPLSLTVAHRSTLQIMELAAALRARALGEGPQLAAPRMGAVPTYTAYPTRRDMTFAIAEWVRGRTRESPRALCGIICRTVDEAAQLVTDLRNAGLPNVRLGHREFDFSPGVIAAAVGEVKGLEFRHVLVVNPSVRAYAPDRPESRNLLYVAATRAEASLDFVGVDEPSPLLPAWLFEKELEF